MMASKLTRLVPIIVNQKSNLNKASDNKSEIKTYNQVKEDESRDEFARYMEESCMAYLKCNDD